MGTVERPYLRMASPNVKPTWSNLQAESALKERQDKIVKTLHSQMMDFKIYSPLKLEACVKKLIQLFSNILQSPDEKKYRKASLLCAEKRSIEVRPAIVCQYAGQGKQCNFQKGRSG